MLPENARRVPCYPPMVSGASLRRVIAGTFLGLLGLYLALMALGYLGQRRMIYPAPHTSFEPRAQGAELWRLAGSDGHAVYALCAAPPPDAPTLVYFHGNGEQLSDMARMVEEFAARGVGVLAVEYPGYGLAQDAATTEANVYADTERALARLRELGVARERTVLVGHSLGSGVAAEMALRGHATRLVLLSPYTSMVDMARKVAWMLPVSLLVRDRYDTLSKAPRLELPVLIVHGARDYVVPAAMGRLLGTSMRNARVEIVSEGGHNDLFDLPGHDLFGRIVAFARGES
jgi:uncharacterized protein